MSLLPHASFPTAKGLSTSARFADLNRMIERREPKGDFNQGVHGMMASSIGNPLGKVSIRRHSAADLERASVVVLVNP